MDAWEEIVIQPYCPQVDLLTGKDLAFKVFLTLLNVVNVKSLLGHMWCPCLLPFYITWSKSTWSPGKRYLEQNASFDIKCWKPSLHCACYSSWPEQAGGDVYSSEKVGKLVPFPALPESGFFRVASSFHKTSQFQTYKLYCYSNESPDQCPKAMWQEFFF